MIKRQHVLVCILLMLCGGCADKAPSSFIAVNQLGYEAGAQKEAYLVNSAVGSFELVDYNTGLVVYTSNPMSTIPPDKGSGDQISILDFSEFQGAGLFLLRSAQKQNVTSSVFKIKHNAYGEALNTVLRSFYYHRCGISVDLGEEWSYAICHLDDAPYYDNQQQYKEVRGGWHDAGDHNKFTVNTSLSAALLMYMYANNPSTFRDGQLGIPESGNAIPDILDEISWALRWLHKMQRNDGAVYHKVSQKRWIGEYLPQDDPSIRYLFEPSTAATASFAATAALGSRLLQPYNPFLASKLKIAALDAWAFLTKHPQNLPLGGFTNPPDVSGGEYGDKNDTDERLWAAMELYNLTGGSLFLSYFIQNYSRIELHNPPPISWRNVHSLALHSFYLAETDDSYFAVKQEIRDAILSRADRLMKVHAANNYRNLLNPSEYYWGSNSVGLAYAYDLLQAYIISGNQRYKKAAWDQLHFVMGRNPSNISQITGVGTNSVRHPYHQLSEKGDFFNPVPGMLVGGPNNHILLNNREISPFPAKSFEDSFSNYFVNEPAINFTAVYALVLSFLSNSNHLLTAQEY